MTSIDGTLSQMTQKSKIRLLFIGGILALTSIFQMGYATAYPNTSIDAFRDFLNKTTKDYGFELTEPRFSWIWSALLDTWFIGFSIGSCIAPIIADRIGRKYGLLIGNLSNMVSSVISLMAILLDSLIIFSLSRLLFSLSAAISMNSLILLLQESSPISMRGVMSFYAEMAFVVTNLVGGMAGMKSVLGSNLPWLMGLGVIVSSISVLVVIPIAESPVYLLEKRNNSRKAAKAIYFYQRIKPSEDLSKDFKNQDQNSEEGSLSDLLHVPHLRKGFLLGLCALQIAVSIWPIVFFSTELLRRSGIQDDLSELISTIMLFFSTLCTCVGMILVERIERRILFISSSFLNLSALLLFVISAQLTNAFPSANIGCVIGVMIHGGSYSIALGPIAWFLVSELIPVHMRASAQSLALAINQMIALLLVAITLPLYDEIGALSLLFLFILPGFICLLVLWRYLPETRNRSIQQIIQDLQGPKRDFVELNTLSADK